jgi:hypothetical protein
MIRIKSSKMPPVPVVTVPLCCTLIYVIPADIPNLNIQIVKALALKKFVIAACTNGVHVNGETLVTMVEDVIQLLDAVMELELIVTTVQSKIPFVMN